MLCFLYISSNTCDMEEIVKIEACGPTLLSKREYSLLLHMPLFYDHSNR